MIYAIQAGGVVKIGYSRNPQKRLPIIQTGSPNECVLIGVMKGTRHCERKLHEKFSPFLVYGEWFTMNETLSEWISENMQKPEPKAVRTKPTVLKTEKLIFMVEPEKAARYRSSAENLGITLSELIRVACEKGMEAAIEASTYEVLD